MDKDATPSAITTDNSTEHKQTTHP